jgi:hypothetical protein
VVAWADDVEAHHLRQLIGDAIGPVILETGRAPRLSNARSHAFKRSRCFTDLTTDGLALLNSISILISNFLAVS